VDPIILVGLSVIVTLFVSISLIGALVSKQDCDDSRVILPK
jgi:hypothetical protein